MEPKSREMPCSSITRNVRCEPVAMTIRKADGNKDCLLFRTSDTVETGQEQQQREDNALRYRCSSSAKACPDLGQKRPKEPKRAQIGVKNGSKSQTMPGFGSRMARRAKAFPDLG